MSGRRRHRAIKAFTTPGIAAELRSQGVPADPPMYAGAPIEVREPEAGAILVCIRANTVFGPVLPPVPSLLHLCSRCGERVWASLSAPRAVKYLCEVCFGRIGGKVR